MCQIAVDTIDNTVAQPNVSPNNARLQLHYRSGRFLTLCYTGRMKTETVYFRIPADLKQRITEMSDERSMSTTLASLLTEALEFQEAKERLRELELALANAKSDAKLAEARVEVLETKMQAVETLVKRSHVVVGTCGECKTPVTGVNLLVAESCPKCSAKLSLQLVAERGQETSDQSKSGLPALLAVLGVVLVVAAVASSEN